MCEDVECMSSGCRERVCRERGCRERVCRGYVEREDVTQMMSSVCHCNSLQHTDVTHMMSSVCNANDATCGDEMQNVWKLEYVLGLMKCITLCMFSKEPQKKREKERLEICAERVWPEGQ